MLHYIDVLYIHSISDVFEGGLEGAIAPDVIF